MQTQEIEYQAEGIRAVGHLALPEGSDKRPGVLVCHEGLGIDDHAKARARRLADECGSAAFALDYIGGGERLSDLRRTMGRLGPLMKDPLETRVIGQAGLDRLEVGAAPEPAPGTPRIGSSRPSSGAAFEKEMQEGGVDWQMVLYGGAAHSFTNPDAGDMKNARHRVPRAHGPALVAGHVRPLRRDTRLTSRVPASPCRAD